jgi:hypothetical protein
MPLEQIEYPSQDVWENRREWFEHTFSVERHGGAYIIGEHGAGLLVDLQSLFCAGAFVSAVVIACTIVDAHLNETELEDGFKGGLKGAFEASGHSLELEWLRKRRNAIVHYNRFRSLPVSIDEQWTKRKEHEYDARKAIELTASVLFENPWI